MITKLTTYNVTVFEALTNASNTSILGRVWMPRINRLDFTKRCSVYKKKLKKKHYIVYEALKQKTKTVKITLNFGMCALKIGEKIEKITR